MTAQTPVEFERRRKTAEAEQAIKGLLDLPSVLAAGAQDRLNEGRLVKHRPLMDGVDFGGKQRNAIGYRIAGHANSP